MSAAETAGADNAANGNRAAVIAACAIFLLFGLNIGIWAAHVPVVQARLALDTATLGLCLLGAGIGTIVSQVLAGLLIARIGSRSATITMAILAALGTLFTIASPNLPWFVIGCVLVGACWGGFNVAMNTQGNEIEVKRGRPTLSTLHAFVSIGMLSSSALGAVLIGMGWIRGEAAAVITVVAIIVTLVAGRSLLPPAEQRQAGGPAFVLPNRAVLGFGVLALLIFLVEGGMVDWSGLFLAIEKGASPGLAPLGFVAYTTAMAIMRLFGERLILALGRRNVVVFGAAIVACGLAVAALSPWLWLTLLAFAVTGAATANIVPMIIASAAQTPGMQPAIAIGAVSTLLTTGLLIGPPFIGFISNAFGLAAGIGVMALAGVAVTLVAALLKWPGAVGAR